MIQLLKDYFDKNGNRYKVIQYIGPKYMCESYSTGKTYYMAQNELFKEPPNKVNVENKIIEPEYSQEDIEVQKIFDDIADLTNKKTEVEKIVENVESVPEFVFEEETETEQVEEKPKDNIKETAEDFYADF